MSYSAILQVRVMQKNDLIACRYFSSAPRAIGRGIESFNDWGGRGCRNFFPVLGGDGTKLAPPGDIFDQPPGEMR